MNYWKVTNLSNQNTKLLVSTGSNKSKGLILKPNEFCISQPIQTPVMDAQIRRKLINVDKTFDNSKFNLNLGESYSVDVFDKLVTEENDKMKEAKIDAEDYVNNEDL